MVQPGVEPGFGLRETLNKIEKDDSVKAVVLRINSPGGTVTASDIIYKDIMDFRKTTGKPVVTSMMDVCASGGYYIACASDYRMAYPTTITGSIGVIVQTLNISGTLDKLGVRARAYTSGPHKDMVSPLRPLTRSDEILIQHLVNQFYENFLTVVRRADLKIPADAWEAVTDGRVVTGQDAVRYGIVEEIGTLDDAIAKAKAMAGVKKAKVVQYVRAGEYRGSIYARGDQGQPQMNMINVNMDLSQVIPAAHPQFLYLWTGEK